LESANRKPRLAVVSPFLDKQHGTERMVVEWIDRLSDAFEIHIYSQNVEDLDLSKFIWHRVSRFPGPHLFNFLWWFVANRLQRYSDQHSKNIQFDIVFSPGPNCLDADAVTVHIVFAEFVRRVRSELKLMCNPIRMWPRLLHRRIYYKIAMILERLVFRNPSTQLILTAPQTAEEICRFFGRTERFPSVSAGLDHNIFNPARRCSLRKQARESLGVAEDRFALLLIGNDWRKKGLGTLLGALELLPHLSVDLLVAGKDDPGPFLPAIQEKSLRLRVRFLPSIKDVELYYAAADAYVGPSLEDTFAMPASEAMACGLPTIISARAGASALVTDRFDGLILIDPSDAKELANLILLLCDNKELRERLGRNAAQTAQKFTWERSTEELVVVFQEILRRKGKRSLLISATEPDQ
jgi:glycosyltransferase involved in cell wall biosynthesis